MSFCLIFWDKRHSGLVGGSILDLFVFPFGDSVFLFGIFVSQSRLTLGYHFPFWLCVFFCGLAGYVFESCFLFLLLSATIFMYYEENMSLNFRNTTCSANHIDT